MPVDLSRLWTTPTQANLLWLWLCMLKLSTGKGRRVINYNPCSTAVHYFVWIVRAGYVLYRALVLWKNFFSDSNTATKFVKTYYNTIMVQSVCTHTSGRELSPGVVEKCSLTVKAASLAKPASLNTRLIWWRLWKSNTIATTKNKICGSNINASHNSSSLSLAATW